MLTILEDEAYVFSKLDGDRIIAIIQSIVDCHKVDWVSDFLVILCSSIHGCIHWIQERNGVTKLVLAKIHDLAKNACTFALPTLSYQCSLSGMDDWEDFSGQKDPVDVCEGRVVKLVLILRNAIHALPYEAIELKLAIATLRCDFLLGVPFEVYIRAILVFAQILAIGETEDLVNGRIKEDLPCFQLYGLFGWYLFFAFRAWLNVPVWWFTSFGVVVLRTYELS